MPISFDTYPRRIVPCRGSDKGLLLIRRDLDEKPKWWFQQDYAWQGERLKRLIHRDKRWRVEYYAHCHVDPLQTPQEGATRYWICRDKAAAAVLAERIAELLSAGERLPLSPNADQPFP